jgi:predicted Zn-dependent protease
MAMTAAAATVAIKLPNSRTAENEADQIGIELAARAGYDPRAAVTLWQKMAKAGGSAPAEFLSTHPSDATRQDRLGALAPKMMPYYQAGGARPTYPVRMGPAGV